MNPHLPRDRRTALLIAVLLAAAMSVAHASPILPPDCSGSPPLPNCGAGSWTGLAIGTASTVASGPGLDGLLYVKWDPSQGGIAEAQWLPNPFLVGRQVQAIVLNLQNPGGLGFQWNLLYTGNDGLVDPSCKGPRCTEVISIGGTLGEPAISTINLSPLIGIKNFASVEVLGRANGVGVRAANAQDPPSDATATATSEGSHDGIDGNNPMVIQDGWSIISTDCVTVDSNAPVCVNTMFAKDVNNHYTFMNISDHGGLTDGSPPPSTFSVSSTIDLSVSLTPGTHTVMVTDQLIGDLVHEQVVVPEPATSLLAVASLIFLMHVRYSKSRRRRAN